MMRLTVATISAVVIYIIALVVDAIEAAIP
jgi:hypothetical protein